MSRGAPPARLLAALVIALLGPTLAAHAAPPPDTEALARRHFTRGKQLFDEHKYREAADEFEAGYAVAAKPGFLLNIGHSYRRAGDLVDDVDSRIVPSLQGPTRILAVSAPTPKLDDGRFWAEGLNFGLSFEY